MLILPLLLIWAPSPMRFSPRLMRTVTTSVLTIALFGPFLSFGYAAGGQPTHCNPLRPMPLTESIWDGLATDSLGVNGDTLKAGTIIPATEGCIVREAGQWLFVADYPEFASIILPETMRKPPPVNEFRAATSIAKVADANLVKRGASFFGIRTEYFTPNRIPENKFRSDHDEAPVFAFDDQPSAGFQNLFPTKIVIADNLMLSRLTSQLASSHSSEPWIVSGRITHEMGSPQLQIHRADRANDPFPFPTP